MSRQAQRAINVTGIRQIVERRDGPDGAQVTELPVPPIDARRAGGFDPLAEAVRRQDTGWSPFEDVYAADALIFVERD